MSSPAPSETGPGTKRSPEPTPEQAALVLANHHADTIVDLCAMSSFPARIIIAIKAARKISSATAIRAFLGLSCNHNFDAHPAEYRKVMRALIDHIEFGDGIK